jgi:hypothetical protein
MSFIGRQEVEMLRTRIGTSGREVGRGCLRNTETKREGGSEPVFPGLNETRRGSICGRENDTGQDVS